MTDLSKITCCVVDHGLFLPLALKLGETYGKVYYHTPQWENGYPHLSECVAGDGFEQIERLDDFWPKLDAIDLVVFPDIQHAGLQQHLVDIGKPVWGARYGDKLETRRQHLKDVQMSVGLEAPPFEVIHGLAGLRAHLAKHDDKYIKISRYRGDMETFHHETYPTSQAWLDGLAIKFGPFQDQIPFVVEDPVKTDIETAIDTYCIDGQFPTFAVHGIERKDAGYLGSVLPYRELPKELRDVNTALADILKNVSYRQFWAAEVRIDNGTPYLIDPCCRHSSPAGETLQELFSNLAEIIASGASGTLVNPVISANIGAQVMLEHKGESEHWRTLEAPADIRKHLKIYNSAMDGDRYLIAPAPNLGDVIGSIVATGQTIKEAVDNLSAILDELSGQPIHADMVSLKEAVEEAHNIEDEGMKFTAAPLPEPEMISP